MPAREQRPWMLAAPPAHVSPALAATFAEALNARDAAPALTAAPAWVFLHWLAGQGYLLHGSGRGDLHELRPNLEADYGQPDDFSNTLGVYAAADGIWPMMYALRGPNAVGQSDMALRLRQPDGSWSPVRYFYALGYEGAAPASASALMSGGFVYVLHAAGFQPSPAYLHGGLGEVREVAAVSRQPVAPLMRVPVQPADFPLPVRVYHNATVRARAKAEPWGFPWLEA